ncbi:perlucin-like [Mytilus trossulus]|uniref:perlucin-like n=1 Tax=Mytilus trossulus TaxID=6551 RepID=UPI003004F2C8
MTLVVLFGLFFLLSDVLSECPLGWQHYEKTCYWFSTTGLPWYSAASSCRGHSAELASVQTATENAYLKYFATAFGHDYWLGGNDEVIEGSWTWVATDAPVDYDGWSPGEPQGARAENCMAFYTSVNYNWVDAHCTNSLRFICEKPYPESGPGHGIGK